MNKTTIEYNRRKMLHRLTIDKQRTNRMLLAILLWHVAIVSIALVVYSLT